MTKANLQHVKDNCYNMTLEELALAGFDHEEYEMSVETDDEICLFQDIVGEDACEALKIMASN